MKKIPNYILYGEKDSELFSDYLHIETIRVRSLNHGWKFRAHQHHNLHQFFFILEGGGDCIIEGKKYLISNNMIIGIPSLNVHGFNFMPDTKGWVLSIPNLYLQNILKDSPLLLEHINQKIIYLCQKDEIQKEFQYLFGSIEKEHGTMDASCSLTLRSLAALLIAKIVRLHPAIETRPNEIASRKKDILRDFQNLINAKFKKRLSVAAYAYKLNITPTHLNRVCRNILKISASELIHERSLLEAKRLLIYTSITIAEISYELGFSDPAHFSKFFKNKNNQQPTAFRNKFMKLV